MNVSAESRSRREHPALSAVSLALDFGCSAGLYCPLSSPLEVTLPVGISWSRPIPGSWEPHTIMSQLCFKVISYQMFLLPAIQLFSPWVNHLKIVCSHPSSACFVCMSRKGNLGFCCNAIHKSLLESITLISSYCTPKKTEKNKNKGEPSMWLLCLAASRLLRKSAWLLRALIRSRFVHVPKMAWVLSSYY